MQPLLASPTLCPSWQVEELAGHQLFGLCFGFSGAPPPTLEASTLQAPVAHKLPCPSQGTPNDLLPQDRSASQKRKNRSQFCGQAMGKCAYAEGAALPRHLTQSRNADVLPAPTGDDGKILDTLSRPEATATIWQTRTAGKQHMLCRPCARWLLCRRWMLGVLTRCWTSSQRRYLQMAGLQCMVSVVTSRTWFVSGQAEIPRTN